MYNVCIRLLKLAASVICDAIWENLSDVAKQHFDKWLKIVRKLVYNSIELLSII